MTKEEAVKKLGEMVKEFNSKLAECEKFADEYGLTFSIYPEYGMGGTYFGKDRPKWLERDYGIDSNWCPSSIGC